MSCSCGTKHKICVRASLCRARSGVADLDLEVLTPWELEAELHGSHFSAAAQRPGAQGRRRFPATGLDFSGYFIFLKFPFQSGMVGGTFRVITYIPQHFHLSKTMGRFITNTAAAETAADQCEVPRCGSCPQKCKLPFDLWKRIGLGFLRHCIHQF